MNDFSELEAELKALRPAAVSRHLATRVEAELTCHPERSGAQRSEVEGSRGATLKLVPRDSSTPLPAPVGMTDGRVPRRHNWPIALALAAAAVFVLLARVNVDQPHTGTPQTIATATPLPNAQGTNNADKLIPSGLTQVVYSTRDEGLHFAQNADLPMRRIRSRKRETLHWQNPQTGASLRVSYPSEEVVLTPISGQ